MKRFTTFNRFCLEPIRKVCMILIFTLSLFQLKAQEMPKSFFDTYMINVTVQYGDYINYIEQKLTEVDKGSLEEAYLFGQMRSLCIILPDYEKYELYKSKEEAYWSKAEINDSNQDYYGQYLLRNVPIRGSKEGYEYLDSAVQYIQNKDDKIFIDYIKFLKSSPNDGIDAYRAQYFNILNTPDLPGDIEALTHISIAEVVYNNMIDNDSAIVLHAKVDIDRVESMNTLLIYEMFNAIQAILNEDLTEAGKAGQKMRDIVNRYEGITSPYANLYFVTMDRFYTQTNQYDSAASYAIKSIELLKKYRNGGLAVLEPNRRLSILYSESGSHIKALETIREAINGFDQPSSTHPLFSAAYAQYLDAILEVHNTAEPGDKKDLITELEKAIVKQELNLLSITRPNERAHLKIVKGRLRLIRSQDLVAKELFEEALAITLEHEGTDDVLSKARYFLAKHYLKQKRFNKAIEFGESVLEISQLGYKFTIDVHKVLINAYTNQGDVLAASSHIDRIQKLIEDKNAERAKYLLSQSEVQQELELQKTQNASLESEQLVKSQLIERQRLIILIIAISIAIIGLFVLRLKALQTKNLNLLQVVEKEGAELQFTNAELGDTIAELQINQSTNQQLLDDLSIHLRKTFNGIKGMKSFIPELGKLNSEQEKYLGRISDLVVEEEYALNNLISLNSILGNHKIDIRRVSISDVLNKIEDQMRSSLKLHQVDLEVEMTKDLVFLADRSLIEMSFISLLQHSMYQNLLNKKLKLQVVSNEGLQLVLEFKGPTIDQVQIDKWLKPGIEDEKNYLSKLSQLKDLMDGHLNYLIIGDLHKVTLKLNLIELKFADTKVAAVDQLEIDSIYNKAYQFLVTEDGLTNPELSAGQLSSELGIPSRKLSYAINTREKTNFSKFLSKIRINKVKEILDNGSHSHLNIAGIGYEAGFNSKSTFFSSFKEFVGCTPKEYVNALTKEAS